MANNQNSILKSEDYNTPVFPSWCPGCGNFGIWAALKNALVKLESSPHRTVLVFGIGCSGNFANFVKSYVFHSLHGRAIPSAAGIKLTNHELNVIVIGGDGDGYAEGLGHFIEACRSNVNLTYIVHDNHVYSLTTGQASPTSRKGFESKTTPQGSYEYELNPLALAVSAGGSFVARGFAGDIQHLSDLIVKGVRHKGFSLIDVMQPCPTFNPDWNYDWYRSRIYKLDEKGYSPDNRFRAWEVSQEAIPEKIALGVLFREIRPTLEDNFPQISKTPLVMQNGIPEMRQFFDQFR